MNKSKCPNPKCENGSFEAVSASIKGCRYEVALIQCTECGTVVGVLDTDIIGKAITTTAKIAVKQIKGEIPKNENQSSFSDEINMLFQ